MLIFSLFNPFSIIYFTPPPPVSSPSKGGGGLRQGSSLSKRGRIKVRFLPPLQKREGLR